MTTTQATVTVDILTYDGVKLSHTVHRHYAAQLMANPELNVVLVGEAKRLGPNEYVTHFVTCKYDANDIAHLSLESWSESWGHEVCSTKVLRRSASVGKAACRLLGTVL